MYETVYLYVPSQEVPSGFFGQFIIIIIIIALVRLFIYLKQENGKYNLWLALLILVIAIVGVKMLLSDEKDGDVLNDSERIEEISSKCTEIVEGEAIVKMYPSNEYSYCDISVNGRYFEVIRMVNQEKEILSGEKVKLYIANDDPSKDPYYDYVLRIDVWRK